MTGTNEIINSVAAHMGVCPQDIAGPGRDALYVRARYLAMYLSGHSPHANNPDYVRELDKTDKAVARVFHRHPWIVGRARRIVRAWVASGEMDIPEHLMELARRV